MTMEHRALHFTRGRFAPSTTGPAHPGTLLAALLCWLDARRAGAEVLLRLEDLDRERTKPGYVDAMRRDLEWLGLDWDGVVLQSERRAHHEAAIATLVEQGRIYACECSRATIRAHGRLAPDGSHAYPGTCRARRITLAHWRDERRPLRVALDDVEIVLVDESGADLSGRPLRDFGDPIVRRRDGAHAYHLVSVVDDAVDGVDRVVRGRDLMPSTCLQVALRGLLGLRVPTYHHHCLLLERHGGKLSKLHGAVGADALRERYAAADLVGLLAGAVGLAPSGERCRPAELVAGFDWSRVSRSDVELAWSEADGLAVVGPRVPERV
jgi:glutamyl-tRNA synthetase/glutamyl-Q tRNA(Asp) synthetase